MITIEIRKANRANGDYSMFVSFPYDTRIIDIIREFPTRYWCPDTKEWEVPALKIDELMDKLIDYPVDLIGQELLVAEQVEAPKDFEFKTKPFNHQIVGFNYGLNHTRWLLGDEQGLGKTKQVIDIAVAKKLQYGYKHCLIVCGVNGLKWNWREEIKTHSNESSHILGQKIKKGKISIGSTQDKIHDLDTLLASPETILDYFIITNVESLRNEEIVSKLSELCNNKIIGLIAADEVHKMKNPTSQQGKGFLKLCAENEIAMTGTPLMNTPLDLYIILKWLGYEKHSFYAFKNHHCIMGGYGGYEVVGYKNMAELQEQLDVLMLRRLKEDVLDLPEKTYIDEYVEMKGKQEQIYKEVTMEIKANIDQISIAPNPLAELIRMRQATGYTGILSSTIKESAKLDRMEELVDDAVENGKKVVIFSNWTQITDVIMDRLSVKGYEPVIITGQTPDASRQAYVNYFQNEPKCKVIVGTTGAMGTGLTLTAGTVEIFLDEPWSKALKDQAEDRCHRIGQNNNVTIYTLITKNTIDERIHELVEEKGALSDAIIDGKITKDKMELLQFLLS